MTDKVSRHDVHAALLCHAIHALILVIGLLAMTNVNAASPAVTSYGKRNPNAPAELDAFAFLVGKWEGAGKTQLPDGKVAEFAVSWVGRYVLDGMVIADEFHSSSPDGSPYLGISLRSYDEVKKAWIVEYINVSSSFLRRQVDADSGSVERRGQTIVVISQSPDIWSRETYRVTSPNHFTYRIDTSVDRGHRWSDSQIEMMFVRKE